jgi:hypothetical protein
MSGADAIEIKATIPHHQIKSALARYGLRPSNDEERYIYFFDSPALELHTAGIIARARRTVGDVHDSTVKCRPVDPSSLGKEWRKYRDVKIEADASEKGLVKSASFSTPVEKGLIKSVVTGKRRVRDLFTREQRAFVEKTARHKIDFDRLAVLGPLRAHRWQFDDPACPWRITAELWIREDGQRMLEASIKAPAVQAAVAIAGFMALLAEVGADKDTEQQTKTRWGLSYYAGTQAPGHRRQATAKSGSKATGAEGAPGPRPVPSRGNDSDHGTGPDPGSAPSDHGIEACTTIIATAPTRLSPPALIPVADGGGRVGPPALIPDAATRRSGGRHGDRTPGRGARYGAVSVRSPSSAAWVPVAMPTCILTASASNAPSVERNVRRRRRANLDRASRRQPGWADPAA